MLKNIKIQFLLSLMLVLTYSCAEDEGNYDYNAINEIKASGIEEAYTVYTGDNFKITPNLNPTLDDGSNADRYTYEWVALNPSKLLAESRTLLGTAKNFDGVIKLAPGKYNVYYFVKDKVTGVTWQQVPFVLNVVSAIYEGWMVIGNVNEKARLDMVSIVPGVAQPRIITDVLDASGSALKLTGKAVDVSCFGGAVYTTSAYGIYVTTTENGTARLDPDSFAWTQSQNLAYETLGGSFPTNFGVDFMETPGAGSENFIYSKGDIFYYYRTYNIKYGLPQNILETDTKTFYAAPFIASNSGSIAAPVFFNNDTRSFVRFNYSKGNCSAMPPVTGSATTLDWNNTNCNLIYMTTSGFNGYENFAVLKNRSTGKYYLLRFSQGLIQSYYKEILNAPEFDKATKFAVSPDSGYLFYAAGGKVYEYDNGTQSAKLMINKGIEEITYIAFNPLAKNADKKLIVGSYGTSGTLELYTVPPVNGDLILTNKYEGLCKIVDVAYRRR
ncbi:PKD-like family lipoprotein [Flavobacterium sp. LHD-80]|uniref:PKD-like family lipoprotein n=1 Tax=Flavobacterium sp. LHD-80 TaxID=3071411 RepID=UPI0027DFAFEB|nr:PKD-like family lipoprotein [Flavobacterium sp. LHD-80]MDQ6470826.1 PKD-like family lipoprotein [Flavobacterium sp. LHD-80]